MKEKKQDRRGKVGDAMRDTLYAIFILVALGGFLVGSVLLALIIVGLLPNDGLCAGTMLGCFAPFILAVVWHSQDKR